MLDLAVYRNQKACPLFGRGRVFNNVTKNERDADFGEREAGFEYLAENPWESGLFGPKVYRHYLVYLKRSPDGSYRPVTGSAVHTILELKTQFVTDPDREAEHQKECS